MQKLTVLCTDQDNVSDKYQGWVSPTGFGSEILNCFIFEQSHHAKFCTGPIGDNTTFSWKAAAAATTTICFCQLIPSQGETKQADMIKQGWVIQYFSTDWSCTLNDLCVQGKIFPVLSGCFHSLSLFAALQPTSFAALQPWFHSTW